MCEKHGTTLPMQRLLALGLVLLVPVSGCSGGGDASPFPGEAGTGDAGPEAAGDARRGDGSILGPPCLDDTQCDDGVECTHDSCNHVLGRCQFVADDSRCQNGIYCDGVERCDPDLGCRQGSILDCSDDMTCTIDSCIEATKMCMHKPRDADGDDHPDGHCVPMGDCDDNDPSVYPGHVEVCGNGKDDNCDGQVDETPCQKPVHDTCADALVIDKSGIYELDTTAAAFDYPGSCAPMSAARRDVVAAVNLVTGPRDVDVVAEAPGGNVSVGLSKDCGVLSSELACGAGVHASSGGQVARFRARSLAMGAYPLYVWADRDEKILLHVTLAPPSTAPTNETCATAAPVTIGTPVVASLVGTKKDLASRCGFEVGDLVYKFDLADAADVTAYATSLDGYGYPVVSIRSASCAAPEDEIRCGYGSPAGAFVRGLAKGTYYVAVSASGPTDVQLEVDVVSPPSTPPLDDTCATAPPLAPNHTIGVSLTSHTDDIDLGCAAIGTVDAAYAVDLAVASDVLLVERIAQGDTGSVSLALASCAGPSSSKACAKNGISPVRASVRGVPAGSYRAVVESARGNPIELTAFVRPSVPPTLVPFADTCAAATSIAESGGFYQGNTANESADFSAGCDVTGVSSGGAADQILKFTLATKKRVVFDMQGSAYATLLDVRRGETCPGLEMPGACSVGYDASRSYLDLTLEPGTYWVQVDGYDGDAGTWFLDVRVVDP